VLRQDVPEPEREPPPRGVALRPPGQGVGEGPKQPSVRLPLPGPRRELPPPKQPAPPHGPPKAQES
jgi:hypothetical protein